MKRIFRGLYSLVRKPFWKLFSYLEIDKIRRTQAEAIWSPETGIEKRVLVLGVYLANEKNYASELALEFSKSEKATVVQAWVAVGDKKPSSKLLRSVTTKVVEGKVPKFVLLNELLRSFDLDSFDYIVVSDDDIAVCSGFLDTYLGLQESLAFSIAQPARSRFSLVSHPITRANPNLVARETCFVEIGPLFSIEKSLFSVVLPFDESSPMGWGYDFVWPSIIQEKNLKMGIIDAVPVNHSIRAITRYYSKNRSVSQKENYLEKNKSLSTKEAFCVLRSYDSVRGL